MLTYNRKNPSWDGFGPDQWSISYCSTRFSMEEELLEYIFWWGNRTTELSFFRSAFKAYPSYEIPNVSISREANKWTSLCKGEGKFGQRTQRKTRGTKDEKERWKRVGTWYDLMTEPESDGCVNMQGARPVCRAQAQRIEQKKRKKSYNRSRNKS